MMINSYFPVVGCGTEIKCCLAIIFNASLVNYALFHTFMFHRKVHALLQLHIVSGLILLLMFHKYLLRFTLVGSTICCSSFLVQLQLTLLLFILKILLSKYICIYFSEMTRPLYLHPSMKTYFCCFLLIWRKFSKFSVILSDWC